MPSAAAKRRKASKKKMKKGETNNNNSSTSSSTHSQGGDDVRSIDERESDSGEFEREEEEEKGEQRSGVVDREEEKENGGGSKDDRNIEVEREDPESNKENLNFIGDDVDSGDMEKVVQNGISGAIGDCVPSRNGSLKDDDRLEEQQRVEIERKTKPKEENLSLQIGDGDSGSGDVSKTVENGMSAAAAAARGYWVPSNGSSEDKEVIVVDQKEEPVNPESGRDSTGVEEVNTINGPLKQRVDYMIVEAIDTGIGQVHNLYEKHIPVVVESAIEAVSPPKDAGDLTTETASAESESVVPQITKSNEQVSSLLSNENEKLSSAVADSQAQKKIDTEAFPLVEDGSSDLKQSSAGQGKEDKLPESFVSQAAAESCKNGAVMGEMKDVAAAHQKSEEKVETPRDGEFVKNGETVMHSDDKGASATVDSTSRGIDNQKDMNNSKRLDDDQPLMGSTPIPVQRMGCCGLFELFSRSR